jgi:hypothetical protein
LALEELRSPSPERLHDAGFDEILIELTDHRCTGCRGSGWRERRHKPTGRVKCRVCQGYGVVMRRPGGWRLCPIRVCKTYYKGSARGRHYMYKRF